jgi:hypothetical protein
VRFLLEKNKVGCKDFLVCPGFLKRASTISFQLWFSGSGTLLSNATTVCGMVVAKKTELL